MSEEAIAKLRDDLYFQLNERISFIKPKDQIISVLFFELGNITQLFSEHFTEDAAELYLLSKEYGFQNQLINERLIFCYKKTNDNWKKNYEQMDEVALKQGERDNALYWRQVNKIDHLTIAVITATIISVVLLIFSLVFFLKWKKLKKAIPTS